MNRKCKDVLILSVPHTGTTFTEKLFLDNGFHDAPLNQRSDGKSVHRGHIHSQSGLVQGLILARDLPLIVPLRHPYLTEESWRRRGKENHDMITGFRNLMERLYPLNPFWMPVDSPKRVECLEFMGKCMEIDFQTDWDPQRSIGATYDYTWEDMDPSPEVIDLAESMAPLLERFYAA